VKNTTRRGKPLLVIENEDNEGKTPPHRWKMKEKHDEEGKTPPRR